MSADPTAEHIDAVARMMQPGAWKFSAAMSKERARVDARRLLTATDPDAQAALAASLPAEVMLAALVDRGALTEEWRVWFTGSDAPTAPVDEATSRRFAGDHRERRRVTPWEVAE